jgi:hypothetical protein
MTLLSYYPEITNNYVEKLLFYSTFFSVDCASMPHGAGEKQYMGRAIPVGICLAYPCNDFLVSSPCLAGVDVW